MSNEETFEEWREGKAEQGIVLSPNDYRKQAWDYLHKTKIAWLRQDKEDLQREVGMFLEMTRQLDEHPEDYEGACECMTCMSYADDDGGN